MPLASVESGTGRALVVLPSFPGDGRLYRDLLVNPLARVVAVDPPGFGRSRSAAVIPGPLTVEAYAGLVAELVASLRLDRPILVGTGLGGYVALELAGRRELDLAGLVVVGCVPAPDPPGKAPVREALAQSALTDGLRAVADAQVDKAVVPSAGASVRAAFRAMVEGAEPAGFAALSRGMALRPDPTASLARIDVPTLVIAGGRDPYATVGEVRRLAEGIPGAQFASIPSGGHLLAIERPAAFRRLLETFIRARAW